jgi:hypothetical protein
MKKRIVFFAIVLCFASFIKASNDAGGFYYGIKAGIDAPLISNTGFGLTSDPRVGFAGGINGGYSFSPDFSMQFEINYFMLTNDETGIAIFDPLGQISYPNIVTTYHYLQIPLLIKSNFMSNADIKPFITIGPAIEFQLATRNNIFSNTNNLSWSATRGTIVTGIGAEYTLPNGNKISIEARGDWWILGPDIATVSGNLITIPFYNVVSILLGYSI